MAEYTYNDMLRMQEEAAERVRAMKKRAALAMDDECGMRKNIPLPDDVRHYSMPVEYENKQSEKQHPFAVKTEKHHFTGRITGDKDILIILAVIWMLSKEKTDYLILLALVYILM